MGRIIKVQDIDQFYEVVNIPDAAIKADVLACVRQFDERNELEPMLREILWDPTETPHGPTEIADILSTKIRIRGVRHLAAFVVKGKSFTKVTSKNIAHQIIRLRQLSGLGLIALLSVGHIQDDAQRDFLQVAKDAGCDYLIIDVMDCARLLLAYEKICPSDGTRYDSDGICLYGHKKEKGVKLNIRVREGIQYEISDTRDVISSKRIIDIVAIGPRRTIYKETYRLIKKEAGFEFIPSLSEDPAGRTKKD